MNRYPIIFINICIVLFLAKVDGKEVGVENGSSETDVRTALLKETEEQNGLKYIPGETIPFTGKIFSPYNNCPRGIETKQWAKEIQLSGFYRLRGKGVASLSTPEGNFWVKEGSSAAGYKLIELDLSKSQPSALIQKGDQQAWIGLRSGNYFRGKKHGIESTYVNGLIYRSTEYNANFESAKKHGLETQYSKAGGPIWYTTQYEDGKRNGPQTEFYWENGKIRSVKQYLDDVPVDVEVGYSVNGIKTSEVPYRNGVKDGFAIENFEDGSPLNRALWVNGEKEGKEIRFYKNGKKYREKNYVDGKLQGTMTIYYENGSKKSVYFFERGILQGVAFRYLEDGSVVEDIWEDGKKISSIFSRPRQNSLFPKNFTTPTTGDAANTFKGD